MKRFIIILLVPALLLGCTLPLPTTSQVTDTLNRKFSGYPLNQFIRAYSYPVGEFERSSGERVYRWVSTKSPFSDTAIKSYLSPEGTYQVADSYNGLVEKNYCEIRIYTTQEDIVKRFAVAVDSMGKFTASRCSEIFYYQ